MFKMIMIKDKLNNNVCFSDKETKTRRGNRDIPQSCYYDYVKVWI